MLFTKGFHRYSNATTALYFLQSLETPTPDGSVSASFSINKTREPSHFPSSMKQERGEKGKKSKMQTALPESPGQIFPPTFELRMPVILPRARFAAAPLLLRPLPTGLTSHDDERTEAQAATAGTARNAVSRPSVPAITFRPRRRQLWPSSATARALPDVLTCARPAPARRAGGRAATAGRGGGRRWVWAVKGGVRRRTDRRRRRETISVRASVWGLQNLPSREEPAAGGRPGPAPARPASGGCSGLWALGSRPATREVEEPRWRGSARP